MNFCCGSFSSIMDRNNDRPKLNRKLSNKENNYLDNTLSSSQSTTPILNKGNFDYNFSASPDYSMMSLCVSEKNNYEENIERYLMSLNQEYLSFGLPAIFVDGSSDADIKTIVFNSWKIIQMLRQNNKTRYSLELRQNKSESEVKHMLQLIENLKNEIANKDREFKQLKLNYTMLEEKHNEITKALKVEKDEVKKLHSIMGHRDSQHKNDLRKKDMEIVKLKERLTQKVPVIKPSFDLTSTANGKNTIQIDSYRDLLHGYELKESLYNNENSIFRNLLSSILQSLNFQIKKDELQSNENGNSSTNIAQNIDDILKLPVDCIKNIIEASFEACISNLAIQKTNQQSNKKLNETFTLDETEGNSCDADDFDQLQSDLTHFKSLCDQQTLLIQNLLEVDTAEVSFLKETDHLDRTIISIPDANPSNQLAIVNKLQKHDKEKNEIDELVRDFYDITPFRNGKSRSNQPLSSSLISLQMTPSTNNIQEMRSTPSMINISCQIPSTFDLYKTLNYINSPGFICTLTSERRPTSLEDMNLSTFNNQLSSSSRTQASTTSSSNSLNIQATPTAGHNQSNVFDSVKLRAKLF